MSADREWPIDGDEARMIHGQIWIVEELVRHPDLTLSERNGIITRLALLVDRATEARDRYHPRGTDAETVQR